MGTPFKLPILAPLAVYSSTTIYTYIHTHLKNLITGITCSGLQEGGGVGVGNSSRNNGMLLHVLERRERQKLQGGQPIHLYLIVLKFSMGLFNQEESRRKVQITSLS